MIFVGGVGERLGGSGIVIAVCGAGIFLLKAGVGAVKLFNVCRVRVGALKGEGDATFFGFLSLTRGFEGFGGFGSGGRRGGEESTMKEDRDGFFSEGMGISSRLTLSREPEALSS